MTTTNLPLLARLCAIELRHQQRPSRSVRHQAITALVREQCVDGLAASMIATKPDTSRTLLDQWRDLDRLTIAELIDWCDCTATEGEPCTPLQL